MDEEIVAMISREGEKVDLVKSIFPHEYKGNVEMWLKELETQMKRAMVDVVANSLTDYNRSKSRPTWIQKWQG